MEKCRFESFKVFSCLKKVNPRILSTFKRSFSKKMVKKPSSHIIHSLGGEYCRIVRDSEPIRLLKSPRSLSVYILKGNIMGRKIKDPSYYSSLGLFPSCFLLCWELLWRTVWKHHNSSQVQLIWKLQKEFC